MKMISLLLLLVFSVFAVGCHTLKGDSRGMKKDWKAVLKADSWIKENMW